MPSTPDPQTAGEWADEADLQAEIAEQLVLDTPQSAGTPSDEETTVDEIVAEQPKVTLDPVGDDIEYPLTLSVVGAPEGGFVFDGPDSSVEVDAQVAEQIAYVQSVEVAE